MKTIVLIISNLFLITAAPVDQAHDIEARSVSEEAGLQALLTQMRDTLANVNNPPVTQLQPAYILNPPSPVGPVQQPPVPQINLVISSLPQQDGATAQPLRQGPQQQLVLANPGLIPVLQNSPQVVALPAPFSSILPQNAIVMPFSIPSQGFPNMIGPLQNQNPAFFGPQTNPYFQPVNPFQGPQNFGQYPFYPQIYPPNPYYNYGNMAVTPPIIFRERGQTVTSQG